MDETAARLQVCSRTVSRIQAFAFAFVGAAAALAASLPCPVTAEAAAPSPPLLDVQQLKPGDKGYGLTVFSGTEPERFDVEVIGVLSNFLPHQDLILVKTDHPRLQVAKVVAGMSGSPVFINGKMVGAYAYGWQFGEESVAGVTPIGAMLDELRRPLPPEAIQPLPGTAPAKAQGKSARAHQPSGHRFSGNPTSYSIEEHARQVAAFAAPPAADSGLRPVAVATPVMIGGMSDASLSLLRQNLSPLGLEPIQGGGGGRTEADAPSRFVDGGAIGVQLIAGDISAAGIGTVTRVEGNRLVAFGHPMMNSGVSRLPTAISRIHWILASKMRSFKIGTPVRPVGALVNDRQAAIVVDSGVQAPMIPVDLEIRGVEGAPHPRWTMQVARERFMAPLFLAVAVGNAIDATTSERRDVSWHAHTTLRVRGHGEVTLHDFGVAVGGTPDAGAFMRSRAVNAMGSLLSNPWEPVDIESIRTRVDIRFARDLFELRGAVPLEMEVEPGRKARIRLQLVPYAGPPEFRTVEVDIPRELAGNTVEIEINPGHQEAPPVAVPESVSELLSVLPRQSYAPDSLVGAVRVGGHGVAFRGQVATRLPPGALDTLRPVASSIAPEPVPSYARTVIPLGKFVIGSTSVRIRVRDVLR
jgi:L-ascorbate metabolism protein UlaG (beta-lactamase superfamily)